MKPTLLATVLLVSNSVGHAKSVIDCAAFTRAPDGTWTANVATTVELLDVERKTLDEFAVGKGDRITADKSTTHPAQDNALSSLLDQMRGSSDLVGELNKSCN